MSKRKMNVNLSGKETEVEKSYLKDTGLENLDKMDPTSEKADEPSASITMVPARSTAPVPARELHAEDLSARTKLEAKSPLSMFYGFIGSRIIHPTQGRLSYYDPSCHMMDYIVHALNKTLCDSFYFKRATPDFHPYILRLYFGVIFWIQCLRAGNDVNALSENQHQFLSRFLDCHPLETLAIPGPLLGLFKTICSSQPEFTHYGRVYPRIPIPPGPKRRDRFMRNARECHFMPNVPGIFALIEDLQRLFNQDIPVYPKRGRHTPVTEHAAGVFGHHNWPVHTERTDVERWSLVSPGLQYPCEADQKLNEAFAERLADFDFPATAAGDDLRKLSNFLSLSKNMAWFNQVKEVANSAASFFEGSGTLADCPPHGLVANQVICCILEPEQLPTDPRCIADKAALYEFSHQLKSTAHRLPPLAETASAYSQTHIRMFDSHPFLWGFGVKTPACGPFWSIRPIGSGPLDDSSYLTIPTMVKRAMKARGPS